MADLRPLWERMGEKAPPPPHFGVSSEGEPTTAHLFSPYEDWKSACGVSMRTMRTKDETELVTCPECAEVTREWANGDG